MAGKKMKRLQNHPVTTRKAKEPHKKGTSLTTRILQEGRKAKSLSVFNGKVEAYHRNISNNMKVAYTRSFKRQEFRVSDMLEDRNQQIINFELNPCIPPPGKVNKAWRCAKKASEGPFEFDPCPFKHGTISHLILDDTFLDELSLELLRLPYGRMSNDLYSFYQTDSLLQVKGTCPAIKGVIDLITGPLQSWIEKFTGKKLSKKVTITSSRYSSADRLLCHDDNLSDRSVAFILYLCKDWTDDDGGSLDLFECDSFNQPRAIVKSIFPQYGSFVFFEVSKTSYHQVAEIISDKERLSINGWYHGEDLPEQIKWNEPLPKMVTPIHPKGCSLLRWINPCWLQADRHQSLRDSFRNELYLAIGDFLKPDVYNSLFNALKMRSIKWSLRGPANKQKYEIAQVGCLPSVWKDFLNLLKSRYWFKFLSQCTVDIDPDSTPRPKCYNELQRWQPGDYMLLQDDDLNQVTGIDVHMYFGVSKANMDEDGGEVYYVGPERDSKGYLEQKEFIPTYNNYLFIMARIEGMGSITKYLDHKNKPFYKVFAHYTQESLK